MKSTHSFVSGLVALALSAVLVVPARAQQAAPVTSGSATQVAPTTPPIPAPPIPMIGAPDDAPPLDQQMKLVGPASQHAQPRDVDPGLPLPEMVDSPDGKGVMIARAKESFSTLTLAGSDLTPQEPVFGSREETADFVRELWQVRWRPNDPIDLYIIRPKNAKKPPVVIYLYGFPADTDRFKDDRFCKRVTQNGAAAIGFVSALTGQRYAYRPFKNWFVSELPESLATTVHDVQMILDQLKNREDLDMTRVGMFGQGSGGAIAVLAAAADPRIKDIDLLDPWGDWPEWFAKSNVFPEDQRATYLAADFQKKLEPLEPVHYLPQLQDRGVRIQFVRENGEPEDAVKKLEQSAPSSAKVIHYKNGREMYQANSDGRLFGWLAEKLSADPSGKPLQNTVSKAVSAAPAGLAPATH